MTKRFEFKAKHRLIGMLDGACNQEHEHIYGVEFTLESIGEMANGLVLDTERLRVDVMPVIARVRDKLLNDLTDLAPWSKRLAAQPSNENFALYFWEACQFLNKSGKVRLVKIRLDEDKKLWTEVSE